MTESLYLRVAAASGPVKVADVDHNLRILKDIIERCSERGVNVAVTPELSLTAYTCADLFRMPALLDRAERGCVELAEATASTGLTIAFGAPLRCAGRLFNCAVIASDGRIRGVVPKTFLPDYNEFYERRWFASADETPAGCNSIAICGESYPFGTDILFNIGGVLTAVEICEDLWVPVSPGCRASQAGATVTLNLSASPELIGKNDYVMQLVKGQSARCRCVYAYASAGTGESSTDLVFSGQHVIAEDGSILDGGRPFLERIESHGSIGIAVADADIEKLTDDRRYMQTFAQGSEDITPYRVADCGPTRLHDVAGELLRYVDPSPFVPSDQGRLNSRCDDIFAIQAAGLVKRLEATGCKSLTVGISGGLDSTLALLVAVKAFDILGLDRKGIHGITMPGFGTTGRTHSNAVEIMTLLGVSIKEIPIGEAVNLHFRDIGHDPEIKDTTYENCQARERTQILMDYANRTGGMVLGTGDLSELALGWCTYNADQMSMYGVNASVPKSLVKYLVTRYARECGDEALSHALLDIAATPISPELLPSDENGEIAQKTEDLVGPYELHDFFIYHTLRSAFPPRKIFFLALKAFGGKYDRATVKHWLSTFYRRFFNQQFKRSCMPDGPKVGSVCLSPRGDWRMPSDASSRLWLDEVSQL